MREGGVANTHQTYNTSRSPYRRLNDYPWSSDNQQYATAAPRTTGSRSKHSMPKLGENVDINMHSQNRKPPNKEYTTLMEQLRTQIQDL